VKRWWNRQGQLFSPDVCYRLGAPIRLDALVLLLNREAARFDVVREFSIYTGRLFGADPYLRSNIRQVSREVIELTQHISSGFVSGAVYKYGVRMDLASLIGRG